MDISFAFRKIQKSIAGLSILAVLASLVSFTGIASADTFPDVDSDHYAYDAVDAASDEGWMTGYDNGDFGVDDTLTRGQAAKLLVAGSDLDTVEDCETDFTDVPTSYSLYDYVCSAEAYGFVSGYTDSDGDATGEYGPNDSVNRAQFAKMVVEAFGLTLVDEALGEFPDVDDGVWYEMTPNWYVSSAWANSVVNGYDNGNYYPSYDVTRGQAAIMINNAQEPEWRVDDEEEEDDTTSDGDLTVEVSSDSPDAMTIPSGATSVELAAWDFTANGGDVTVDSLSVHHYGISTLSSTHQVYLYEGSTRLTSGTTVSSTDNEATFTYDIDVASGETRTISVRMDVGTTSATGEVGLEIASASKVDAGDATVDGDFPAQGAKHTLSTTAAGTVTIEKNGNVDNPQVGEDGASIAKFKISSATEAAGVEELGLYLAGSINTADVENFNLYVSGDDAEALATVEAVDDLDVIRFEISGDFDNDSDECENSDGYCISKGGSKSFYVTADFNTGRTDDTVKVYVDQSTDVFAKGALYGSGMSVTRGAYNGDTDSGDTGSVACDSTTDADCSYSLLEGGDVTISSNGPSAMDVATNARDVSVLDFSIVSVTDVTFDSFPITMDTTEAEATEGLLNATAANFSDVKIMNTDTGSALYAGVAATSFVTAQAGSTAITEAAGDDAAAYHLFTDDFEMEAGEELNLSLTMDIANTSTLDSMTFTAGLDLGATYPQLKDSNNKTLTNSSVLVPSSAITSKTMTVRTPSLALSLASTPGVKTWVKGSDDVPFSGLTFACGDSSDCRVTDLTLQAYYDDEGDSTDFDTASDSADHTIGLTTVVGSVWLEDSEGNVIAASKSINSSTFLVVYDSMDWELAAGETAVAYVHGDISTSATTQNVAFGISSAANVTVEDEDGNSFSATAGGSTTGAVNATPTAVVTTSTGGSLTVAVSSNTARENIVVAGASDVEVASFEFTSTDEAFTVQNLSLNNRQSAATTTALGDYDDNVVSVTVEYEDVNGDTQTSTGTLTTGTASFSGLSFYVPADSSATLTAYATINSISAGADAATFIDLAIAFNNFEAIAESSGETYKADKADTTVASTSDLDFLGTTSTDVDLTSATYVDGNNIYANLAADVTPSLGTTSTVTVNDQVDTDPPNLPVGTILCQSADSTCASNENIYIVTSWSQGTTFTDAGNTGDSVVMLMVDNAAGGNIADATEFVYSLPGTGYFTGTNQMVVYETKPTLALSSSSPTSASASSTEKPFYFTVTADSAQRVKVRTAQVNDATAATTDFQDTALNGTFTATDALSTVATGGLGNSAFQRETSGGVDAASIIYTFGANANLSGYNGISYWCRSSSAANSITLTLNDDAGTDQTSICQSATDALVANTWTFTDKSFVGVASTDLDVINTMTFAVSDGSAVNAATYDIDRIVLYTEKITVDVTASDNDIDSHTDGTDGSQLADNLVGYLKLSGGTTEATGYWHTTDQTADGNDASITFYPQASTDTGIEVAAGASKTYYLETDTVSLIDAESGVDDPVQYSIDMGTSSGGTVTAGDFFWFDDNTTVRWLGYVTSTTLYSNALKY